MEHKRSDLEKVSLSQPMELKMNALRKPANFHFFQGHMADAVAGIRFDSIPDDLASHGVPLPSLVVGPSRSTRWSKIIPPKLDDQPKLQGDKVWFGSIVKEPMPNNIERTRDVMVAYRDENAHYVEVRTGLRPIDVGGAKSVGNHWMMMAREGIVPKSHGVYDFTKETLAAMRIAAADADAKLNEEQLAAFLKDPNFKVGQVAAERMDVKTVGRRIKAIGCPETSFVLYRMPYGSVLLVRDIEGQLKRIISSKDGVRVVDAKGYDAFFDGLEDAHQKRVADARAAKTTAASSSPTN